MDSTAAPAGRAIDHTGSPSLGTVPLLVGRAREQAALREALAGTAGGHGRLVLLGGEAGIGRPPWPATWRPRRQLSAAVS